MQWCLLVCAFGLGVLGAVVVLGCASMWGFVRLLWRRGGVEGFLAWHFFGLGSAYGEEGVEGFGM